MRLLHYLAGIFSITFLLSAQDAGHGGPMILVIPSFPDGGSDSRQVSVKPRRVLPRVRVRRRQ